MATTLTPGPPAPADAARAAFALGYQSERAASHARFVDSVVKWLSAFTPAEAAVALSAMAEMHGFVVLPAPNAPRRPRRPRLTLVRGGRYGRRA